MNARVAKHSSEATKQVAAFVDNLTAAANSGGTFDSVAAETFASESVNQGHGLPDTMVRLLDDVGDKKVKTGGRDVTARSLVVQSVLDGIANYTEQHGEAPGADMVEAAIYQGYSTTNEARERFAKFDSVSADNQHSDATSLQPNRAVIAITGSMAEAIPYANYLPYDIGSNEARLIVVSHVAGSTLGAFKQGDLMDGVTAGMPYLSTSRVTKLDTNGAGKITGTSIDEETCDPTGPVVNLLRGRTIIYVMGLPAGGEISNSGNGATSPLSGSVRLGTVDYTLSGTVKPDTGEIAATFTPALPANTAVHAEGFIDLEKQPLLTPMMNVQAQKFQLYATPWRAATEVSIDARTQFANEVGISPETETVLAIRNQFGNERHYQVLKQAQRLGAFNTGSYPFNWALFGQQKDRSQIVKDMMAYVYPIEQRMANITMDHGITHWIVDEWFAGTLKSCDSTIFQPSGVTPRPSIYRLGRLFGTYDVYVNPRARAANADIDTSVIQMIGRSTQAGRNPFVLGDAVAPMAVPISTGVDFKTKAGFYARNFTSVNPHIPSAMGCATLTVTGLSKGTL